MDFSPRVSGLDVLEMAVLEMRGIFEAETKEAVEANVRRPDQNERKELWFIGEKTDCEQKDRGYEGVRKIIDGGAHTNAG